MNCFLFCIYLVLKWNIKLKKCYYFEDTQKHVYRMEDILLMLCGTQYDHLLLHMNILPMEYSLLYLAELSKLLIWQSPRWTVWSTFIYVITIRWKTAKHISDEVWNTSVSTGRGWSQWAMFAIITSWVARLCLSRAFYKYDGNLFL